MNSGVIVQVNVSAGGVPKRPVERALVGPLGIQGDKHLYRLHGGPQKALLLMTAESIDTLSEEGFRVYYGALGENLTIRGMDHRKWQAGQQFQIGSVIIELTEARVPCSKLNPFGAGIQKRIFDRNGTAHWGESGFYAAVLEPGHIAAGDTIEQTKSCLSLSTRLV